ncbi:MAG: hypothetical protein WD627_04435 [Actinomycetota bacterium]
MSNEHTVTDDIVYDLISIQYHAMKAGDVYDRYLQDAHDHEDVVAFLKQCKEQDAARAQQCHDLIKGLMQSKHIG